MVDNARISAPIGTAHARFFRLRSSTGMNREIFNSVSAQGNTLTATFSTVGGGRPSSNRP